MLKLLKVISHLIFTFNFDHFYSNNGVPSVVRITRV